MILLVKSKKTIKVKPDVGVILLVNNMQVKENNKPEFGMILKEELEKELLKSYFFDHLELKLFSHVWSSWRI